MQNQQSQGNIPMVGMDRDTHPSRLKESTYTFAKNISLEDSSGNGLPVVQNEPSNLLCQNFDKAFFNPELGINLGDYKDYKIVGFRFNPSIGRTYFMFANENKESSFYGISVIGYINRHVTEFNSADYDESCGCVSLQVLDNPLENQVQQNLCEFKIIAEDSCTRTVVDGQIQKGCLGFSTDNPIFERNIRFKNEQCGRRMYWTDRNEVPRFLDLDMIEVSDWKENIYRYKGSISCGEDDALEQTCLDCEKLKMIPDYSIPCLLPSNIALGGQLKLGSYEFLIAYCDEAGNELSNYFSHTNPINVFDYNNVVMDQTQLGRTTNYAIELKVSNLDEDFKFYKVAVIQHTEVNGEESYLFEGVHPVTDKTVLYTSDRNKARTTLNHLLIRKVKVQSVEQMIDSNGYLFMAGIKNKPVLNLQPIVNLMGPYLKWTSIIAKENFYQNGINASTSRSYMRDETYPFSFSFGMSDGTETNDTVLIGRAPQAFVENGTVVRDLDTFAENSGDLNFQSIQEGKNACGANERIYRWQYENTAKLKGSSSLLPRCTTKDEQQQYITALGQEVFSKIDVKECNITEMKDGLGNNLNEQINFQIKIDGDFRDHMNFLDYVNDRIKNYLNPSHQLYSSSLSSLLSKDKYSVFHCSTTNSCNCLDEDAPQEVEIQLVELDITPGNGLPTYSSSIVYEELDYVETQFVDGMREEDFGLSGKFLKPGFGSSIHLRPTPRIGDTCENSIPVKVLQSIDITNEDGISIPIKGTRQSDWGQALLFDQYRSVETPRTKYIISYQFDRGDGLERPKNNSERIGREFWNLLRGEIYFSNKISKSAVWIKTEDIKDNPYLQVNFSSTSILGLGEEDTPINEQGLLNKSTDTAANKLNKIRVSIYDTCSVDGAVKEPLKVIFLEKGKLLNLKTELASQQGRYLVAIDTPLIQLIHIKFDFVRIFEWSEMAMGLTGHEVPKQYQFMEKRIENVPSLGGRVEVLYAHNVDDNGNRSGKAFAEANVYNGGNPTTWGKINYNEIDRASVITSGTDYSLMVVQRGREVDYMTYNVNFAKVHKIEKYRRECFYEDLDSKICEGRPFEEGMFSYVESTEQYPDNEELFNSYNLGITEQLLDEVVNKYKTPEWQGEVFKDTGETVKDIFIDNFGRRSVTGTPLEFFNEDKANFACKPIRHFKFPNNNVSPFLYTNDNLEFQSTFVFPLGVSIDKNIVNIFLDLAVKTNLITQKQRDSIEYFKVKRGDRTLEKTILSKGLLTDVIKYKEQGSNEDRYFPNFPFNSMKQHDLLSRDGYAVNHPFQGKYNNKFVFNSPEVEYNTINSPTEISIEGFQSGTSEGQVDQVKDHGKMVLLTPQAINTADALASTESAFEVLSQVAELGIGAAQASSGGGFLGFSGVAAGAVAGAFVGMVVGLRAPMIKDRTAELRNKWIEIFKNRGIGTNFAHYITSVGFYNNYSNEVNGTSRLRRVAKSVLMKDGNYNVNLPTTDGYMKINNVDREKSLFLYLGSSPLKDGLRYTPAFYNIDDSSREPVISGKRELFTRSIANLYAAIKVWKSDQYGELGNIKWVDITGCNYLTSPGEATFFGGDVYISKYAYKRKFNFFLVSGLGQGDFTPFKYSHYFNVGRPKYFVDYETEHEAYGRSMITTPSSTWNLADPIAKGNYITDGRFYHYQYGIPYFFVESTINCWNRYAGVNPEDDFYPNVGDYMDWTQESRVSIRKQNTFNYNYVYSLSGTPKNNNLLPSTFVSKFYNCTNNSPNGIMYSSPDASEKQKVDPWLVYKNFDFYNFPTSNGKLIDLVNIESTQILGMFENQNSIFNAIDVLKERVSPETKELGSGGIFAQRPIDSHRTDQGYGGTQHKAIVSCEFGHFWVDARRGHVHQKDPNGQGQTEITQGLRNWFQEHLPFKILKGKIEGLTDIDLDNPFRNIGISMGYDSRFKRIFITKLDYVVKPAFVNKLEWVFREGFEESDVNLDFLSVNKVMRIKATKEEVSFDRADIFEPVFFTLAYSPLFKTWISYYDFTPGFYISYDGYFSTGSNSKKGSSIWSHLLTNKSYGVFNGKKYGWALEVPTKEQMVQKSLSNIEFWMDSIRYHNNFDYALNTKLGLDRAMIYNHSNSSGYLNLITREPNNRYQASQYPKVTKNGVDILVTYDEGKWSFNDFFNRAQAVNNNVPLWNYDKNAIDKVPNPKAITYTQRWLDRLRGDWFLLRLEGGKDSRFKQMFKWINPHDNIII